MQGEDVPHAGPKKCPLPEDVISVTGSACSLDIYRRVDPPAEWTMVCQMRWKWFAAQAMLQAGAFAANETTPFQLEVTCRGNWAEFGVSCGGVPMEVDVKHFSS